MSDNLHNMRSRHEKFETFRTPDYCFAELYSYRPEWFSGSGFDPSAGDGRMLRHVIEQGNVGPHYANDIREEELATLSAIPNMTATVGDYLEMTDLPDVDFLVTNPPFTKAVEFVQKAQTHVSGPICILQSIAWQTTRKRSDWLRGSGLAYVLNITKRPKWEVDSGGKAPSNIWDFAWFVFLPGHTDRPIMDWL